MGEPDLELLALLQLNLVSGIGPRIQTALLEHFGSAVAVLEASGGQLLAVDGVGPKLSAAITAARNLEAARTEHTLAYDSGVELLLRRDARYPEPLGRIFDPPGVLYCRGELLERDALAVAIVGSRQTSSYGRKIAEQLGYGLALAGFTVISGLARGIDAAAHRGALKAGGRTIAVCATGLAHVYPPEHVQLAEEICRQGALVSESPMTRQGQPGLFPQRNRIIAGMSQGVVIVEAGRKSGALHRARHAQEQGREVFAVPGRIDHPGCLGCLDLLTDGATLVRGIDDILDALGPLSAPVRTSPETVVHAPRELTLNEQERDVLSLVETEPTPIDHILAQSPIEPSRVLATLTVLEMKRLIRRQPGGFVERTGR
ncbi:MAG: DNA-processing protein DprA [Planctomycetaceae bacterium]|nr:DNA-processing protein DprA [Planctomycetaceae bacterium]